MVERGEIWWVDPGPARGGKRLQPRPVLVVQADEFNQSRIGTIICVLLTSDVRYSDAPGNVLTRAKETGLPLDTVANVAQIVTFDRPQLSGRAGSIGLESMKAVDAGLRMALAL